ncbi:MAG: hypothetical protein LUC16_02525 [Coprobacillus sp.]|nr:hypothetical protein [Coprobacillus sp.]
MDGCEISYNVLTSIICEDVSFNVAMKRAVTEYKLSGKDKNEVSIIVGCSLRHYYIFHELVFRYFGEISEKSASALYIMLSKLRFLNKDLDEEALFSFVKHVLEENDLEYEAKNFDGLVDYAKNSEVLIPPDIEINSPEYLHFRYNVPTQLVKMWQKHLGKGRTQRVLRAFTHTATKYYRVNTLLLDMDRFDSLYSSIFDKVESHPLMVTPKKDVSYHELLDKALASNHIYSFNRGVDSLLNSLDIPAFSHVALEANCLSTFHLALSAKLKDQQNSIDVIIENGADYYRISKSMKSNGVTNMRFYNAAPSAFITCISEPVDYFFLCPHNSNFELLRLSPDYAYHFKMTSLDALIEGELTSLTEASKLLAIGGEIIYIVPTISNKESKGLIHQFVSTHPDFELVEERQFLPIDDDNCTLYYGIIKKKVIESKSDD